MADSPEFADLNSSEEFEARQAIGAKVLEMVDRVKVAHAVSPGAYASWGVTVDGVRHIILLQVAADQKPGS